MQLTYLVVVLPLATWALDTLDPLNLQALQMDIFTSINRRVLEKRSAYAAKVTFLKADFLDCNKKIQTQLALCKTCSKGKCEPGVGKLIEIGWDKTQIFFNNVAKGFISWRVWEDIGDWLKRPYLPVENLVKHVSSKITPVVNSGKKIVRNVISSASRKIKSFFGRKRRSIDPLQNDLHTVSRRAVEKLDKKTLECMSKCAVCSPFITGDTTVIINAVCGDAILVRNATLKKQVDTLYALYQLNNAGSAVVKQIEYNKNTFNKSIRGYTPIVVSAKSSTGTIVKYTSLTPYYILDRPRTTEGLVNEILAMWNI